MQNHLKLTRDRFSSSIQSIILPVLPALFLQVDAVANRVPHGAVLQPISCWLVGNGGIERYSGLTPQKQSNPEPRELFLYRWRKAYGNGSIEFACLDLLSIN
jgi:hypothetical protein